MFVLCVSRDKVFIAHLFGFEARVFECVILFLFSFQFPPWAMSVFKVVWRVFLNFFDLILFLERCNGCREFLKPFF